MTPYAAYLRVYEPLSAFTGTERELWTAYAASGRAPDRSTGVVLEHDAGRAALLTAPPIPKVGAEAFVLRIDGGLFVCPWRTRERAWSALADFGDDLPEQVTAAFFPPRVGGGADEPEKAEGEANRGGSAHPGTEKRKVP
ncbi:MAG: hypothetical protein ACR2JO_14765, partial [Mycobacteriales bacterium]